jgi:hypothetical protein
MWMSKAPLLRHTAIIPLAPETPALGRCLAKSFLLCVDADERGRPGRVVGPLGLLGPLLTTCIY